jgi:hypothetical protein
MTFSRPAQTAGWKAIQTDTITRRKDMNTLSDLRRIVMGLAVIAGAALITTISVNGQGQAAPGFEGTWRVDVIIPGAPAVIKSLQTYAGGGAAVEYNTASSFPRYGVWERVGPQTFVSSWEALINNPNVPQVKRVRVRNLIEVDHGFASFTGRGQVLYLDENGNQINSPNTGLPFDCARLEATRMQAEAPDPACP